jgi:hypothetical protein
MEAIVRRRAGLGGDGKSPCIYQSHHSIERHFGWKAFRVLTVTTDQHRMQSMIDALRQLHIPHSPGPGLFFFAARETLRASELLVQGWCDGNGRDVRLI